MEMFAYNHYLLLNDMKSKLDAKNNELVVQNQTLKDELNLKTEQLNLANEAYNKKFEKEVKNI